MIASLYHQSISNKQISIVDQSMTKGLSQTAHLHATKTASFHGAKGYFKHFMLVVY